MPATYKLTYFPVCGRGGPLRQAFTIAGVNFEDERITFPEFGARKAADAFPYGMVPVLEIKNGDEAYLLGESSAIMNYICREHGAGTGLQQGNSLDAAKVDEARSIIDDLTTKLAATVMEKDLEIKKASREHIASAVIPKYFSALESRMQSNGHVVGDSISAADLLIGAICNWISGGVLDGISSDILDPYANVKQCWENIKADPKLAEFYKTKA